MKSSMNTILNEIQHAESFLAAHETELQALLMESKEINNSGQCDTDNESLSAELSSSSCDDSALQPAATNNKRPRESLPGGATAAAASKDIRKKRGRNKICEHPNCNKGSSFNYEGVVGYRFCSTHKLRGMVNIRTKKKGCEAVGCGKEPFFNFKTSPRGRFCIDHKLRDMVVIDETIIKDGQEMKNNEYIQLQSDDEKRNFRPATYVNATSAQPPSAGRK